MSFPLIPDRRLEQSSIEYNGREIRYTVRFKKNAPLVKITLDQEGTVDISAPTGISREEIIKRLTYHLENHHPCSPTPKERLTEFQKTGLFSVQGENIPYTITSHPRRQYPELEIRSGKIMEVRMPPESTREEVERFPIKESNLIVKQRKKHSEYSLPPGELCSVNICGTDVPYQIRRSVRAKRCTLKVHHDGTVEVVVPDDMKTGVVIQFVQNNTDWIAPRIGLSKYGTVPDKKTGNESHESQPGYVEWDSYKIPYTIRRSNRAKNIIIRIGRDHVVSLIAPPGVPENMIHKFARDKASWIYDHSIGSDRPASPVRTYSDGEVFPWFGEEITLRIRTGTDMDASLSGQDLIVQIPDDLSRFHESRLVKKLVENFATLTLYAYLTPLVEKYAEIFAVQIPDIKIRNQKTKWGACTQVSVIFNVRLCMAPPDIIEYVVAHELCHKIHHDHSPRFWHALEEVYPHMKEKKGYLKRNGYLWTL